MFTLFDQNEELEDYIVSELREQTQRTAKILYGKNMSVNDIAEAVGYSVKIVERWLRP